VVDWAAAANRLSLPKGDPSKLLPTIELRWILKGELGMPSGPFQIYPRPHSDKSGEQPLAFKQTSHIYGVNLITWPGGSMSSVSLGLQSPTGGLTVKAFMKAPENENVCAIADVPFGASTVYLNAPVIDGVMVPDLIKVNAVRGVAPDALSQAAG